MYIKKCCFSCSDNVNICVFDVEILYAKEFQEAFFLDLSYDFL